MISIVYCTREENKQHSEHLKKVSGNPNVEVIEYINKGESLTKFYNKGLNESKYDIVLFVHDDIIIDSKQIANKIVRMFDNNPEYGIIGVAGTKYMSESGRWWDNLKFMYGRVTHMHEGRTWLSEYSGDQDKRIEEMVIVDGLFFVVNKTRIKKQFDESVQGFHFYDVDFCFQNYLEGVKVGVTTEIKVTHKSIGMTNEQWELNRQEFAEKFKDKLPIKINETFEHRKLKVLIGCLSFSNLTGSELLTLETAKGLSQKNCDVSVVSTTISDKFKNICKKYGIKTYLINEPPHYRLGDGNWGLNTPEGFKISEKNKLYRINNQTFDIIHANHTPITQRLLQLYPESNFVNTIGSEIIDLENPVIDEKIKKYIAVRPSIKDYIINNFSVSEDLVDVVYNPLDNNRFKPKNKIKSNDKDVILFVGTMDYLRHKSILSLVNKCGTDNNELWLVGKDTNGYASNLDKKYDFVKYFGETDNIEEFYHKCDITAGIMLGRTTIEGFLCGKPGIIYNVDKKGEILGSEFHPVPEDLSIFDYDNIISKIKNTYIEVFNHQPTKPKINTNKKGVSIIIPTYNNVNYIEDCLDSIKNQDYFIGNDEYEILVGVDGCEYTLNKLLEIKEKYNNLKIIEFKDNMGAYVTMNSILPLSLYDDLIVFGSDDIMKPNMVKDILDISDDYDIIQYKFDTFLGGIDNKITNECNHMFAIGCIYIKKSVFDICGGYCVNKFSSDLELLLRVSDFVKLYKLDKSLFMYRKHNKNLTSTVPLSERAIFDNKIRNTKYTLENVKIDSKKNKINKIY